MTEFIEVHDWKTPVTIRAASIHSMMPDPSGMHTLVMCAGRKNPLDIDEPYGEVKELLRRAGCRVINGGKGGKSDD